MKLQIKETGELLEDVKFIDTTLHKITIQYLDDGVLRECTIKNLSDIEEVKDYEEPKEYWCIDWTGGINHITVLDGVDKYEENKKEIGNYFETKEEAEKAVEKLKAWKRLKDKGFRFEGRDKPNYGEKFIIECSLPKKTLVIDVAEDLDLIFGGEE